MTQRDVGDKWHDGLMNTTPADTRLGIHADFGSLLGGLSGRTTDLAQLPHLLFEHGRVLVQASAGLGKSALLRDLADLLKVGGTSVGIVALRELERDRRVWTEQDDAEMWIVDHLPQNGQPFVLLLDGLDEVPHRDGQRLLDAIEHVTRGSPEVAVVATDRLGRRSLRLNRWLLVSLSSRREALDAVAMAKSWCESAQRNLPSNVAALAAQIAMQMWSERSSVVGVDWLSEIDVTASQLDELTKAAVLQELSTELFCFPHLLIQSYFAADWLRSRPTEWRKSQFESITLDGASYEGLGILLAMVSDAEVDNLVRRVDDWNFYAAAFLLAEDFESAARTSRPLRTALLFLLGRRRFSGVPSTVIQVEDSLRLNRDPVAQDVLLAASLGDLVEMASVINYDADWWNKWKALFCDRPQHLSLIDTVEALKGQDGVMGWTAANVFAAKNLDDNTLDSLHAVALTAREDSVRWRAIHAIGGTPSVKNLQVLLQAFETDASQWVRNGALRSFMQVTAKLPDINQRIAAFKELSGHTARLLENPKWLREVERSSRLMNAPQAWPETVGILIEQLWSKSDSVEEQDRWRNLSASLRTDWVSRDKLGSL
ncbi:hypothetical protein [Rhodococcoides fascians]|uniref:hypothetical protein n=1 Tax=Rhodococcoides fascians TaxID=1828 RepID=UPI00050C89D8|nr:hypothetical protein [Rhodococcus fascians]